MRCTPLWALCFTWVWFSGVYAKSCDIKARMFRKMKNNGFHRELYSNVELIYSQSWDSCIVALKESFPSGLFVNPDELANHRRMDEIYACPAGVVNVEAPEYESEPCDVYVYALPSHSEHSLSASFKLPFHLRYHYPTKLGGYRNMTLYSPWILLRCDGKLGCKKKVTAPCSPCDTRMCQWLNVSYVANVENFTVYVPVGNLGHSTLVITVTMFVTGAGCLYILLSVRRCNHEASSAHRKKKHRS